MKWAAAVVVLRYLVVAHHLRRVLRLRRVRRLILVELRLTEAARLE